MTTFLRTVPPSALMAVRHQNGRTYFVLADRYAAGDPYLNTYSRNGHLKLSRACTVPVQRQWATPITPLRALCPPASRLAQPLARS